MCSYGKQTKEPSASKGNGGAHEGDDEVTEPIALTARQRGILDFIEIQMRERGYPPSVREIGEAVGLTSTSTVHAHLSTLQRLGYLRRDPTKPRAIEVRYDSSAGAAAERPPTRHVPLFGAIGAATAGMAPANVEGS